MGERERGGRKKRKEGVGMRLIQADLPRERNKSDPNTDHIDKPPFFQATANTL